MAATRYTDGTIVPKDFCITPDHVVTEFTVKVRSLGQVPAARLKDVIQQQFEVVGIKMTDATTYVVKVRP